MRDMLPHLTFLLLAVLTVSCGRTQEAPSELRDIQYADVPFSEYGEKRATIRKWAGEFDDKQIALHGFKIWAALTADSGQTQNGVPLPRWDTFYSETEVFNRDLSEKDLDSPPNERRPFHELRQGGSQVLSFNKYNLAFRKYVLTNEYNKVETLMKMNEELPPKPLEERMLEVLAPIDGLILKPTYWAVKHGEVNTLPYWKGPELEINGTVQPEKPTDRTWTQVVIVNDTGQPVEPEPVELEVYSKAGPETITVTPDKVVTVEDFYALRLTAQDIEFIKSGAIFQFGGVKVSDLEPGDWALLVGCHVTSVEWEHWTWQTFWWSPFPEDPHETGRPGIKPPWTNYDMASAYYMVGKDGKPHIAFNPHLETPIAGQIYMDQFQTGSRSNCMTCHRAAGFPTMNGDPNPSNFLMGSYVATGVVTGEEQWWKDRVQTEFMWGMVLGLQAQSQYKP